MKISENFIDILLILDICRYLFLDISNFGIDILYIFRYLIYSQISHVYNLSDEDELVEKLIKLRSKKINGQLIPFGYFDLSIPSPL